MMTRSAFSASLALSGAYQRTERLVEEGYSAVAGADELLKCGPTVSSKISISLIHSMARPNFKKVS